MLSKLNEVEKSIKVDKEQKRISKLRLDIEAMLLDCNTDSEYQDALEDRIKLNCEFKDELLKLYSVISTYKKHMDKSVNDIVS